MDQLSSQEGEIPLTIPVPIPIPINTSFRSGGHGHLIHHHQQQHPHDPTAAATARAAMPHNNNKNNHSNFLPPSTVVPQNQTPHNTNGSNPMHTGLDHSHEEEQEEQEEEHHDHFNNANANVVPYKYNTYNNKKQAVVGHNGVRYKECLKNHAAAMGGTATDGCGEFMPSGEEGTIEALNCSACHCHRNFHRKEVEGEQQQLSSWDHNFHHTINRAAGVGSRKFLLSHERGGGGGGRHKSLLAPPQYPHQHQMIMSNYNMGMGMIGMVGSIPSDQSNEQEDHHHHRHHGGGGGGTVGSRPAVGHVAKKRFRTKFTQEQKEKMLNFAEKVGWKIQKQEDSFVQNFCQEIGVKRRVLKVWMHNNKHNLANKINPPPPPPPAP